MARYGVWATNTPGVFANSTADCTLGMIINLARQLVRRIAMSAPGNGSMMDFNRESGMALDLGERCLVL